MNELKHWVNERINQSIAIHYNPQFAKSVPTHKTESNNTWLKRMLLACWKWNIDMWSNSDYTEQTLENSKVHERLILRGFGWFPLEFKLSMSQQQQQQNEYKRTISLTSVDVIEHQESSWTMINSRQLIVSSNESSAELATSTVQCDANRIFSFKPLWSRCCRL